MRSPVVTLIMAALVVGCGSGDANRTTTDKVERRSTPAPIDLRADTADVAARLGIPILCYHQLRPRTGADSAADRPYIVPPAQFRSQLDTLVRRGYHTISPDQLLAHLTTGARLPSRPVMLTFDDAVDDHYRVALPELRRRNMTGTFFVMTVVLGGDGYLTRGQVRRLDRAGMSIGAHTWDHHRVDEYSGDDWRIQVDESVGELERIVGHPVRVFAYPFGVWSRAAFPHLRRAGLWAAFQLTSRPVTFADPLMTIRRKIASPDWSTEQLARELLDGFRKVGP